MNKTKRNNGFPDTPNGFLHFFATVTRVNQSFVSHVTFPKYHCQKLCNKRTCYEWPQRWCRSCCVNGIDLIPRKTDTNGFNHFRIQYLCNDMVLFKSSVRVLWTVVRIPDKINYIHRCQAGTGYVFCGPIFPGWIVHVWQYNNRRRLATAELYRTTD